MKSFLALAGLATASATAPAFLRGVPSVALDVKTSDDALNLNLGDTSVCDYIESHLPSECQCTPNGYGGVLECEVSFFGDDVDFSADMEPCASTAEVVFEVSVADPSVDFHKTVSLGTTDSFDIPGLTLDIPDVASAAAVLDVTFSGNLDSLSVSFGLDACASVLGVKVCGSNLDSSLPYTIFEGTYDFSNLCQ